MTRCVPSHVCLHFPADSCVAQSCRFQYMLGKVISMTRSNTHVCCSTLLLLSLKLSTRWSSSLMGLVAIVPPTVPLSAALCGRYIKAFLPPLPLVVPPWVLFVTTAARYNMLPFNATQVQVCL